MDGSTRIRAGLERHLRPMGHYQVIEEIALADCALDIHGRDLRDLFETAARALVELMVDPRSIPLCEHREVTLGAEALDDLLYDFLSDLILRKDRDGEVFTHTQVRVEGAGPWTLAATLEGGAIDDRTVRRADPKAVTLHRFILERSEGGWHACVVIDI